MERLTKRDKSGKANPIKDINHQDLIERLAYYEDLEEQGRLVVLETAPRDTYESLRPKGKWIQGDYYAVGDTCNLCDYDSYEWDCTMNFCPNCGADMRKE